MMKVVNTNSRQLHQERLNELKMNSEIMLIFAEKDKLELKKFNLYF